MKTNANTKTRWKLTLWFEGFYKDVFLLYKPTHLDLLRVWFEEAGDFFEHDPVGYKVVAHWLSNQTFHIERLSDEKCEGSIIVEIYES